MPAVLGYWKIRGVAQPIRLLLHHVGEEFKEKFYEVGEGPEFSRDDWLVDKGTLSLDFPTLPYFIDGDVKIANSTAILRHIARKHDMCGSSEKERIRVDVMVEELTEFRNGLIRLCYIDYKMLRPRYEKDLPNKLRAFNSFLGKNKFFAGENITFVDFVMYELLDVHRTIFPECLDERKNLQSFIGNMEALPNLKKYMDSPKFIKNPINNKMAKCFNE